MFVQLSAPPPNFLPIFKYYRIKHKTEVVYHITYDMNHYCAVAVHLRRDLTGLILQKSSFSFIFCLLRYRVQVCSSTILTYDIFHTTIHIIV